MGIKFNFAKKQIKEITDRLPPTLRARLKKSLKQTTLVIKKHFKRDKWDLDYYTYRDIILRDVYDDFDIAGSIVFMTLASLDDDFIVAYDDKEKLVLSKGVKTGKESVVKQIKKKENKMAKKTVKTKAYTINRLISEVSGLKASSFNNLNTFATTVSPVAGVRSAKVKVLSNLIGQNLSTVFATSSGVSAKNTMLRLLRARKSN
jgi:hypothetical protein